MWLVATSEITDVAVVRDGKPALWRELRRFNAPIQLAVAAAHEVVTRAIAPAEAAIISLAPCQSGSPELHRWVRDIGAGVSMRVNPTHTLHAVDNLALSVLTMSLGNRAWGMSLGGAAGMMWTALELALERDDNELIVLAGDQTSGFDPSPAAGVAMLFARERTPHVVTGRPTRLVAVERHGESRTPVPHAASGTMAMLAALRGAPIGQLAYVVPATDGTGLDDVTVRWEIAA